MTRFLRAVAAPLLLALPAAAHAQTGNGSDVTGPNTAGSSIAGGIFALSFPPTQINTPGGTITVPPNLVIIVNTVLGGGFANIGGSSFGFSPESGNAIIGFGSGGGVPLNVLLNALLGPLLPGSGAADEAADATVHGPSAPRDDDRPAASGRGELERALAEQLAQRLSGILRQPTPRRIAALADAYNRLVDAAPAEYLRKPPETLVAIRVLIDGLIAAK